MFNGKKKELKKLDILINTTEDEILRQEYIRRTIVLEALSWRDYLNVYPKIKLNKNGE